MFIENCAAMDMSSMGHRDPGENSMLIRITDPCGWMSVPKHNFKESHHFTFMDLEDNDCQYPDECKISDSQAEQLVDLLRHALENNMNVIVHFYAGLCRSGAVAEVGTMMGFTDTGRYRQPNVRVKTKMMRVLGWTYD